MDLKARIEGYLDLVEGDPLWNHVNLLGIQNKILEDTTFIERVAWGVDYSTAQAVSILSVKNKQQILNIINRHDLKDYVDAIQSENGYYSFTHKSLFRLKIIFVLRDYGLQPLDIATISGTVTQYSSSGRFKKVAQDNELSLSANEIESIVDEKVRQALQSVIPTMNAEFEKQKVFYEESIKELQVVHGLAQWELKMQGIVNQIELLENQKSILLNQSRTKPNLVTKILGIYSEENDTQIDIIISDIDKRLVELVNEKGGHAPEKESLLLQHKKLKAGNTSDTLNIEAASTLEEY